ncbi:SUMF1/EgtB/PvdO family nonheme iron enzyme [Nodosilinea sp. LEGE 07298]|uniref:SUMF1/EgtB/PvdO family nonheme iron enzyme n=1 Tax=Nodosilinea sp. LEGE 07298 TaxID=2777970 RepID=UPI00188239A9|nr:SUMF1/EgtB/PvdO family nonheme iron enzyme [Nodosilinea sp. LEGE 07298]MBE9112707.1 SUMF1/EgtB/PvdO family nonheme iron enzyme [Nodosilinea sp. LEGE 07298]
MSSARSIFISYRRRTSIDITGRLYDRLVGHFGENSVFKDVDSIPFGVNFRHHLEQEVSHCPVLLAIIDPDWLGVADDRGRPKLANPADWVRIEIETALQRDRLVIPVLVGGAALPEESALPEGLKALAYRQSAQVRCDPDFHRDLDRLIHRIEGVFSSLAVGVGSSAIGQDRSGTTALASPPVNLIDELAAALATANQTAQAPVPRMGRRRWLRMMGLGILGGGSALAIHQRVPALQTLATGEIPPIPDLSTLPDRIQTALEQAEAAVLSPGAESSPLTPASEPPEPAPLEPSLGTTNSSELYSYESVNVDEFGMGRSQIKFATPSHQALRLETPIGPVTLRLVAVVGGQFVLGAPDSEPGYDPSQPAQAIAAVDSFWMSVHPITQAQWRAVAQLPEVNLVLNPNPAYFTGNDRPVEQVSWAEAVEFCERLNQLAQTYPSASGLKRYRLPTEAEWEYACRAKTTTPFHTGQTITTDLANYNGTQPYRQEPIGQFRGTTTAVGAFGKANDFGLYDMHGNVLEWCSAQPNPSASDPWRVVRGGSWQSPPQQCRSAFRSGRKADTRSNEVGFRIVGEG